MIAVTLSHLYGQIPKVSKTMISNLQAAKVNYNQGNYAPALKIAFEVLNKATALKDSSVIADADNLIGLVELSQNRTIEALVRFNNAKVINQKLRNANRLSANLLNIALAYADLQKLDSAIVIMKQSLNISHSKKIAKLVAMGNNHLADFYFRKGNSDTAAVLYQRVINSTAYQDNWENSFAYTGLAKIDYAESQYPSAANYADAGYRMAIAAEAKWDAAQALELSHRAYEKIGNYKTAYERLLLYKKLTDSLFNDGKEKQIINLELRSKSADNHVLRSKILLLDQRKKIDRLITIGAVFLLTIGILSAFIVYKRVKHQHQLFAKDLALEAERNRNIEE
ncbi:hypothetical protein [Mucilaginibacter sp. 44-25]|uniref:hypothetical protein n=1 Tax=Mucilaginibacter sp. 44-25 TaxID=1895794 RepID=UPI00095CAA30|nr:hypothetical protein [Mucilaginibacter sp. 44-25]OJW16861.1 MAG: hypothetical protein BGO48_10405 [Mucilaginibacter sp. 44-25]